MRMAQFRQVLRQSSLLVFLPAQTFEHLNILNTAESLMDPWTAVTVRECDSIVAGEEVLYFTVGLEKNKSDWC